MGQINNMGLISPSSKSGHNNVYMYLGLPSSNLVYVFTLIFLCIHFLHCTTSASNLVHLIGMTHLTV